MNTRERKPRTKHLNVMLSETEHAFMRRIAEQENESAGTLVRRWIRANAESRGLTATATKGGRR